MRGIGQVAKLLAARAEVCLTRAFGSATVRQERCRPERGVEVTVREQQGWRMKHENGEGEMERYDIHTANTLSHACTRCLYVTQGKSAKNMCVRHGVCVQLTLGRMPIFSRRSRANTFQKISARLSKNGTIVTFASDTYFSFFCARSLLSCRKLHWSPFEHWPFSFHW